MMPYDITSGSTFYGYIPDNSDDLHLAIVLNEKDGLVKYCYCTSKHKKLFFGTDSIEIEGSRMASYYKNVEDKTYIYISEHHIFDILLITLNSRIDSGEYDLMEPIDTDIYVAIMSKIRNSDNISERFKQELFAFLE
jgi:hypothetical protein